MLISEQIKLEKGAYDFSKQKYISSTQALFETGCIEQTLGGRYIIHATLDKLASQIKQYLDLELRGVNKDIQDIIAISYEDKPKELAYLILVTLLRMTTSRKVISLKNLISHLVTNLYKDIQIKLLEKGDNTYKAFIEKRYKRRSNAFKIKEKRKIAERTEMLSIEGLNKERIKIGAVLIELIVNSNIDIIDIIHERLGNKTRQYIKFTDNCNELLTLAKDNLSEGSIKYPIFVVPPRKWGGFEGTGGYYTEELYKVPIIKHRGEIRNELREYFRKKDKRELLKLMNNLQATPWIINKRVLDTISKIVDENIIDPRSLQNNPYLIGGLPYGDRVHPLDWIDYSKYGGKIEEGKHKNLPKDKTKLREFFKEVEENRDTINANFGKAISLKLALNEAKFYSKYDEIYFSYQYDFRGRVYPLQQYLNPQGNSVIKSLLLFKNGCKITNDKEIKWFLIHGANCFGYSKLSYDERIELIRKEFDNALLVASNPLKYRELWQDTDEPFMYLAWCFELEGFSKDPKNYLVHIPISLDATCSGIQIYSGLLRDPVGAKAVNVTGQVRSDIYQQVADLVNKYLEDIKSVETIDFKVSNGEEREINVTETFLSLRGKITRELTKQNTMTLPYSVTKYGMSLQLRDKLQEMERNGKVFWKGEKWIVAKILTELNHRAINEIVQGAKIGQQYLKDVCNVLTKRNEYVAYTVPLSGFPVVQKIKKTKEERISTTLGRLSIKTNVEGLNNQKMVNGIAPNFVHSIDASMLFLTVKKLEKKGCMDFHMVHDSFGVPVNHVEDLNKAVRESFLEVMECNPLKVFKDQVLPEFEDPELGNLELKQVLKSTYFFS